MTLSAADRQELPLGQRRHHQTHARPRSGKRAEWNHFQITADGDHLVVVLNGETTLDIRDAKFPEGHIRLQYQQFPIAFRNIKIRSLP